MAGHRRIEPSELRLNRLIRARDNSHALDLAFLTNVADVTELILVRHGQQFHPSGQNGPVGEMHDAVLSDRGRVQARLVGERFASERIDAVYSSNLSRAYETGAEIARHHAMTPTVVADLREVGVFRDLAPEQSILEALGRQALLGIRSRMIRDRSWDVYPFSESSADFRRRTVNAIEGIAASHPGERIVIACHGGVICAYLGWILAISQDMWFRPAHTSVQVVRAREQTRAIDSTGDTRHLLTPEGDLRTY